MQYIKKKAFLVFCESFMSLSVEVSQIGSQGYDEDERERERRRISEVMY